MPYPAPSTAALLPISAYLRTQGEGGGRGDGGGVKTGGGGGWGGGEQGGSGVCVQNSGRQGGQAQLERHGNDHTNHEVCCGLQTALPSRTPHPPTPARTRWRRGCRGSTAGPCRRRAAAPGPPAAAAAARAGGRSRRAHLGACDVKRAFTHACVCRHTHAPPTHTHHATHLVGRHHIALHVRVAPHFPRQHAALVGSLAAAASE